MNDELWNVISGDGLSADETTTLTQLLRQLLLHKGSVGTGIQYDDEKRTSTLRVLNVSIIEATEHERGCIVASVYEHPARMVVAVLNQPGGDGPPKRDADTDSKFEALIKNFATS